MNKINNIPRGYDPVSHVLYKNNSNMGLAEGRLGEDVPHHGYHCFSLCVQYDILSPIPDKRPVQYPAKATLWYEFNPMNEHLIRIDSSDGKSTNKWGRAERLQRNNIEELKQRLSEFFSEAMGSNLTIDILESNWIRGKNAGRD